MKVQLFALCCLLVGTVRSMPTQDGSSEEEEDSGVMIVGCLAENWREEDTEETNLVRVGTCLKCLEEAGDPLSAEGLPKIKQCLSTYMPAINQECARDIANVAVQDIESGMTALHCFEEALERMGAEWCLSKATATDIVDKMTEAVGCVLETHKNATDFVRAVQKKQLAAQPEEDHATKPGMEKLIQLVTIAHCDVAAEGDETRSASCKACFGQMFVKETAPSDGHIQLAEAAKCSATYLMPYYQDCQPGLDSLLHVDPMQSKQKGAEVYKCYTAKLMRYVVSGCVESTTEATAENLSSTMQCGKQHIIQWAMQTAGPELAAKLKEIFPKGSEDDNEDV